MQYEKKSLPKKSENLSDWYNKIVLLSELADYGPAKGTMIFRPYGYAIWELIQKEMDREMKRNGIENAYFPLFIPESLLNKEKEHVEGFAPELAVVTIGGGKQLQEKLIVRPTSETIMYEAYARWIHSWRDLPVLLNQWNNVVRWEKRTYLFLRTTEFLWQEGHTAHETHDEAWKMVLWAIEMYAKTFRELLAVPGYVGRKSSAEKFAGADTSLSYESLMPEGKALQSSTAHDLGQNFATAFDIKFQNKKGESGFVWQTSWGFSTRSIGGLIMVHGDDLGLKLPPKIAPIQVIILPVNHEANVLDLTAKLTSDLEKKDIRVKADAREDESLGYRINKWELKGVPLRIEIGPQEVASNVVTLTRRDTLEKSQAGVAEIGKIVANMLEEIQTNMFKFASAYLTENTHQVNEYSVFKDIMGGGKGFLNAFWCERAECESSIKNETTATTRCLPVDAVTEAGSCIYCGQAANHRWLFAQAY